MELVFNELSVRPLSSVAEGKVVMSSLIQVLRSATMSGMKRVLRSSVDIGAIALAPGYSIVQWRNDKSVNNDETTFFRLMTARYPILSDLPAVEQTALTFDWKYQNTPANGLGVAALLDTIAVSLRTSPDWEHSGIVLDCTYITDDEVFCQEKINARHASRSEHVGEHAGWIFNKIRAQVTNGPDVVSRHDELLPRLVFCGESLDQIRNLNAGHPMLHAVLKKLFSFQDYAAGWVEGAINLDELPMRVTPESKTTLDAYPHSREFRCPDGALRDFQWHARLTPGAWRLHFAWDDGSRQIFIGYVGPHLPTATDPT